LGLGGKQLEWLKREGRDETMIISEGKHWNGRDLTAFRFHRTESEVHSLIRELELNGAGVVELA
jgi:hypothetical protein